MRVAIVNTCECLLVAVLVTALYERSVERSVVIQALVQVAVCCTRFVSVNNHAFVQVNFDFFC